MWIKIKLKFAQPSTWAGVGTIVAESLSHGFTVASLGVFLAGIGSILVNA